MDLTVLFHKYLGPSNEIVKDQLVDNVNLLAMLALIQVENEAILSLEYFIAIYYRYVDVILLEILANKINY